MGPFLKTSTERFPNHFPASSRKLIHEIHQKIYFNKCTLQLKPNPKNYTIKANNKNPAKMVKNLEYITLGIQIPFKKVGSWGVFRRLRVPSQKVAVGSLGLVKTIYPRKMVKQNSKNPANMANKTAKIQEKW